MNDLISFLVSGEAILVYIIAFVVSVIYVGVSFIKNTKQERVKKQNTMELNKLVEKVEEQPKVKSKTPLFIIEEEQEKISKSPVAELEKKEESIKLQEIKEVKNVEVQVNDLSEKEIVPEIVPSVVVENTLAEKNHLEEANVTATPINVEMKNEFSKVNRVDLPIQVETLQEKKKEVIQEKNAPEEIEKLQGITYTSIEPKKEEAKQQLAEITEKLETEKEEKEENIELTEFERLQEDTAIISLDELMKRAGELYEKNEEVQYTDEGNEPISLADLEKRKQEVLSLNKEEKDSKKEVVEQLELENLENIEHSEITSVESPIPIAEERKFKSSPVISPVYGIESNQNKLYKNSELELENTANYEKLDAEIRKTNQFIAALKELQKKLD